MDALCAGGCGKTLKGSRLSLPAGQRRCQACRRSSPAPYSRTQRACAVCGGLFCPTDHPREGRIQRTCSAECGQVERYGAWLVSLTLAERKREVDRRKNTKRRGTDIISEPYTLAEIAKRDRYRCGLCRRKVDMSLPGVHPEGPTIDHIIPLSISRDDRRANVQLAHRTCNVAKGARIAGEQLLLIG